MRWLCWIIVVAACTNKDSPAPRPSESAPLGEWRRVDLAHLHDTRGYCLSLAPSGASVRRLDCKVGGPVPVEVRPAGNGSEIQGPLGWIKVTMNGSPLRVDEAFRLADRRTLVIAHSIDETTTGMKRVDDHGRYTPTTIGVVDADGVARELPLPFDSKLVRATIRVESKALAITSGMLVTATMEHSGGGCEHTVQGRGCDPLPPSYRWSERPVTETWAMQLAR